MDRFIPARRDNQFFFTDPPQGSLIKKSKKNPKKERDPYVELLRDAIQSHGSSLPASRRATQSKPMRVFDCTETKSLQNLVSHRSDESLKIDPPSAVLLSPRLASSIKKRPSDKKPLDTSVVPSPHHSLSSQLSQLSHLPQPLSPQLVLSSPLRAPLPSSDHDSIHTPSTIAPTPLNPRRQLRFPKTTLS
eukprot:TRINITY_DN2617_c0_g1_i5.p1 TRINITY_DN2617_c0_g1~~TRINITY_DN2617_c0_g1_i5.p1  ORF type:complete len:190 (+),score=51.78 TRINITY_DN2617_c0_g1_i5:71-640(+)